MRNKIAVYTANFGNKDEFEISNLQGNFDFILFTDNQYIDHNYNKVNVVYQPPLWGNNSRKSAKIYKLLPHIFLKDYEYTLWIDSNIVFKDFNIEEFVDELIQKGLLMSFYRHPERNSIYDEAGVCMQLGLDSNDIINIQMNKYKLLNYPDSTLNLLLSGGFILRKNKSKVVKRFNEKWFFEVLNYSLRDQLSLPYVIWEQSVLDKIYIIENWIYDNNWFYIKPHIHNK